MSWSSFFKKISIKQPVLSTSDNKTPNSNINLPRDQTYVKVGFHDKVTAWFMSLRGTDTLQKVLTLEWPALWRIMMNSLHNEGIYK